MEEIQNQRKGSSHLNSQFISQHLTSDHLNGLTAKHVPKKGQHVLWKANVPNG